MANVSILYPKLFQSKPAYGNATQHGFNQKTTCGFIQASARLFSQLQKNETLRGTPYTLAGTVNMMADLTLAEHTKYLAKIMRVFKVNNIESFWRREPSKRTNRIGYHFLIANEADGTKIKALIRNVIPKNIPLNQQFDPFTKQTAREWMNYILKSKVSGIDKKTGEWTDDVYRGKRVLFSAIMTLDTYGSTANFWVQPPKTQTKAFTANKKAFKQAINKPEIDGAAHKLADLTGHDVEYVKKQLVKELLAYPNDKLLTEQNRKLANDWWANSPEAEEMREEQRPSDTPSDPEHPSEPDAILGAS